LTKNFKHEKDFLTTQNLENLIPFAFCLHRATTPLYCRFLFSQFLCFRRKNYTRWCTRLS